MDFDELEALEAALDSGIGPEAADAAEAEAADAPEASEPPAAPWERLVADAPEAAEPRAAPVAAEPPAAPAGRLVVTGWRARGHSRLKTVSGTVRVVHGISGDGVCEAALVDASVVADLKATGVPAAFQRLMLQEEELRDLAPISRLPEEEPTVSVVYGLGDALEQVAAGELDLRTAPYLAEHRELVLAAVRHDATQLGFATEELRGDKEIVMAAIHSSKPQLDRPLPSPLARATDAPRRDREVVLAAVLRDGLALRHASAELRGDREIVAGAVRGCGAALEHASEAMRSDMEIVILAFHEDHGSFRHATPALRRNREFVEGAVRQDGMMLEHAAPELRSDPEIVLAAVQASWKAFQFASEELRRDPDFVLRMLKSPRVDKDVFWYASDELKGSGSIVHGFMAELYPGMYGGAAG